ncbi:MAG: type II toxin-antitoxin system HipA family toxin [Mycobacteriales bacterium]|nr:type II toxin-antitoxin system HipA family toxin [Mycobacteriales bacterium]
MTLTLDLHMDGRVMGVLSKDEGRLRLRYDDAYRGDARALPLSLAMPLAGGTYADSVVQPWLWGLLPDNDAVLKRWARSFGVSQKDAFGLLTEVGEDCAGAVQFLRPGSAAAPTAQVAWLTVSDVADRLRELRTDPTTWQIRAGQGQFSLAGAQAKIALHRQGARWGVAAGPTPTTHILKPSVPGLDDHDVNEHLCLALARELGLAAALSHVLSFDDERAIVVTRYDRRAVAGTVRRVHQEDLCQALGRHPSERYQTDGGPSAREIARLLARTGGRHAKDNVERFVDALVLHWLIGGTDAHAKNYSVLMHASSVRLAPLYDVASALPYDDLDRHRLSLAMKVGHNYSLEWVGRSDWVQLAHEVHLDPDTLVLRAIHLARSLPSALEGVVSGPDITALDSALPARLLDLLTQRAERCSRALTTTVIGSATLTAASRMSAIGTVAPSRSWSADEARTLLAALTSPARALLVAVCAEGGDAPAGRLKAVLATTSLQGRTSPVPRALQRLQARGSIAADLQSPIESYYADVPGRRPVAGIRLAPGALKAFQTALEPPTAAL